MLELRSGFARSRVTGTVACASRAGLQRLTSPNAVLLLFGVLLTVLSGEIRIGLLRPLALVACAVPDRTGRWCIFLFMGVTAFKGCFVVHGTRSGL